MLDRIRKAAGAAAAVLMLIAVGLVVYQNGGFAAWDATKPATNQLLVSSEIRANWDAIARTVGSTNLVADPTFLIWQAGDSAAGAHWLLTGAGTSVARAGTGLGDATRKIGPYSAKVISAAGAQAFFTQDLLPAATFDTAWRGRTFSCGAWVSAAVASTARTYIYDGVTQTFSSFQSSGATFQWLTQTKTLSGSATLVQFGLQMEAGTRTGYLSAPTCVIGEIPPADYQPAPVRFETREVFLSGNQTTGTDKARMFFERPGIVKDVFLSIGTAPTGQALIVDVNTWDGAAFTSMYSTRPQIAAAASRGIASPDSTYARRNFTIGTTTGTPAAGEVISFDVDQIGSGTAGANLTIYVRFLTYERPLEAFLGPREVR